MERPALYRRVALSPLGKGLLPRKVMRDGNSVSRKWFVRGWARFETSKIVDREGGRWRALLAPV